MTKLALNDSVYNVNTLSLYLLFFITEAELIILGITAPKKKPENITRNHIV